MIGMISRALFSENTRFFLGVQKGVPQESTKNGMVPAKHDQFVFFNRSQSVDVRAGSKVTANP